MRVAAFLEYGEWRLFASTPLPGLYASMKIRGVTGSRAAQKAALWALGTVEE